MLIFHVYIFGQQCSLRSTLTELPRLWSLQPGKKITRAGTCRTWEMTDQIAGLENGKTHANEFFHFPVRDLVRHFLGLAFSSPAIFFGHFPGPAFSTHCHLTYLVLNNLLVLQIHPGPIEATATKARSSRPSSSPSNQ